MTTRLRECVIVVTMLAVSGLLAPRPAEAQAQPVTLSGRVMGSDGSARPDAIVRLTRTDISPQTEQHVVRAGTNGEYTIQDIQPGQYTASADAPATRPGEVAHLTGLDLKAGEAPVRNLVMARSWFDGHTLPALVLTIGTVILYALLLLFFRFYNIIAPTRALLRAQISSVRTRLNIEVDDQQSAKVALLVKELTDIETTLGTVTWGSTLFWSRGEEIAAWARIHEVERQLATFLAPLPRVIERVRTAEAELRSKSSPESTVLADRMRDNLQALSAAHADPAAGADAIEGLVSQLKHQLAEALGLIYDRRDTGFAALMEWQNKAMWLTNAAILLIAVLALSFEYEWLFLIGAAGGLMSRLARSLFREDVASDYGASWTTLFLSPLLGAIAAWFGILLIAALRDLGMFGTVWASVRWPPEFNSLTAAMAFVLGFSERLFTALLSAVEGRVQSELQSAKPQAVAAPPPGPAGPPAPIAPLPLPSSGPAGSGADPIRLLDLTKGERAALVGDAQSLLRPRLTALLGEANVFTVGVDQLSTVAPLDGVLLEKAPEAANLPAAAAAIRGALATNGRLVVIGSTPAGLFESDAETQREKGQIGPALVHEAMTKEGLLAQEPPERLDGGDPVRWFAAFLKPPSTDVEG